MFSTIQVDNRKESVDVISTIDYAYNVFELKNLLKLPKIHEGAREEDVLWDEIWTQ